MAAPDAVQDVGRFRWVQDLLEILDNSAVLDEFLENTKLELYQDQVFCFTPKGQLIPLPRGATPVDFAYAVHSQVGDACVGAKVNGRLVPLRHVLENGDQVEIMTARGGTPSPAWERFVVTGKARARIRRHVAQQQRANHISEGRAALAKAFRQEGVDGQEKVLEAALKTLKFVTLDDLYVAVGNGNIGPRDVVHAAYPELRQSARMHRMVPLAPRPAAKSPSRESGMPITGLVSGMAVHFAGCCHPLPGDAIVAHRQHREGRHHPHARLPDARELCRDAGAVPRCRLGLRGAQPRAEGADAYRADHRDRGEPAGDAREPHQRDREARRGGVQPQDRQPPAGFPRGAGRCGGARPAPPRHRHRRRARGPGRRAGGSGARG